LRNKVDLVHGVTITLVVNFRISAEYGHSDRNGGILPKKRKNSAKMGMVGSYAVEIKPGSKWLDMQRSNLSDKDNYRTTAKL